MSLSVYIDYGTGMIELTNYDGAGRTLVRKQGLSKTEILHKNGESVINTCSFKTDMPTGLANDLINLNKDAQINLVINKDGMNWFTGYARPVTSFNVSIEDGYVNRQIEWQGVDSAWALKKVLSSGRSYSNKTVCDPADTTNSLVHLLLTDAGISSSNIDISITIDATIPLLSLEKDDKEYFKILSELLFYYGCALNVAPNGSFYVYKWADDNVPDKATIDAWPSSETSFSANRNDIDSNRVQVKWSKVDTYSNRTVININANIDIEPLSGGKYPPDGSTEHPIDRELDNGDKITSISNLRLFTYIDTVHAIEPGSFTPNKSVRKWIQSNSALNFSVRDKYNWSRWGDNWASIQFDENLSDWKVNIQIDLNSNVDYQLLQYPYVYPDDVIATSSEEISLFKIGSYKVVADIETLGKRWTTEVGSGQKLEKIEAEWIYSEANAKVLAQAVLDLKEVSSTTFDVRIDEDVLVGTYRRLQNPHLNIDTVVRVLRKTDSIESAVKGYKAYRYTVEAVRPLSVLISNISGTNNTAQTAAEIELGTSSAVVGLTPDGKIIKAIESGIIENGFIPDKDGLYFSDTRLGFFKDGAWKSYLLNDGTFKFKGDGDNYIEWDSVKLQIMGDLFLSGDSTLNGRVTTGDGIVSDNYVSGESGWNISGDGNAEFNDVTARGVIEATSGEIGGWTINADNISAGVTSINDDGSISVGLTSINADGSIVAGGNFSVSPEGLVTASDAVISGVINADSGLIGGWTITDTGLEAGSGGNKIVIDTQEGIYFGSEAPETAPFHVDRNGYLQANYMQLTSPIIRTSPDPLSDRVVFDTSGIRGYDGELGLTFELPTDGSAPRFSNGIIEYGTIRQTDIISDYFKTSETLPWVEMTRDGVGFRKSEPAGAYGTGPEYGDGTKYGVGVSAYFGNAAYPPLYIAQELSLADIRLYNRATNPTGRSVIGDIAVVDGVLKICTSPGTPGIYSKIRSDLGTASLVDTGTGAGEVPLNSDLGTTSIVDHGTAAGEVPLNSDLGTAAVVDHGTGAGEVPLNSYLIFNGQFSEVGVTRGLVSLLPLIGDTKDRVTNLVATNNGATPVADGYEFDGVDDYISADVPNNIYSDFTIEFEAEPDNWASSDRIQFGALPSIGPDITDTDTTTADFSEGTLTDVVAVDDSLQLANNYALSFDGVDDYVSADVQDNLYSDFTIEFTLEPNNWDSVNRIQFGSMPTDTTDSDTIDFGIEDGTLSHWRGYAATEVSNNYDVSSLTGIHHITYSQERLSSTLVEVKIYIDGSLVDTVSGDWENTDFSLGDLIIGNHGYNTRYWLGTISNVRLYNIALTPEEIAQEYNAGMYKA